MSRRYCSGLTEERTSRNAPSSPQNRSAGGGASDSAAVLATDPAGKALGSSRLGFSVEEAGPAGGRAGRTPATPAPMTSGDSRVGTERCRSPAALEESVSTHGRLKSTTVAKMPAAPKVTAHVVFVRTDPPWLVQHGGDEVRAAVGESGVIPGLEELEDEDLAGGSRPVGDGRRPRARNRQARGVVRRGTE